MNFLFGINPTPFRINPTPLPNKRTVGRKHVKTNATNIAKKGPHLRTTMKCSPAGLGKRIRKSCYTPAILELIRKSYNRDHAPAEQIHTTDPTEIWKQLNAKLVHCSKEDCWLNQIKDPVMRKKIDRYIFAPDQPYEWKSNPTEWLSNYDIMNVLEQYEISHPEFEFIGPTPIDFDTRVGNKPNRYEMSGASYSSGTRKCVWNELCQFSLKQLIGRKKRKIGIVFNLDKHDQSGSHWVSMFIDIPRRFMFYFDSAGGDMPPEIRVLMDRIHGQAKELFRGGFREYANGKHTHQQGNTECGMYSLFFIITMLTGRPSQNGRRMSLERILRLFLKERIPDKMMVEYRGEYFNSGNLRFPEPLP